MSSGQIIGQIIINNEIPVYSDRYISDMKLKIGALYRFHRGINQNKLGTCLNELKMIQGRFNKWSFSGLRLNIPVRNLLASANVRKLSKRLKKDLHTILKTHMRHPKRAKLNSFSSSD